MLVCQRLKRCVWRDTAYEPLCVVFEVFWGFSPVSCFVRKLEKKKKEKDSLFCKVCQGAKKKPQPNVQINIELWKLLEEIKAFKRAWLQN